MTLGNMRQHGVRSLAVYCGALHCHHEAVLDVTSFADDVTVPAFGQRMVCAVCGAIGADARPNWNERGQVCLFGRPSADDRPGYRQAKTGSFHGSMQLVNCGTTALPTRCGHETRAMPQFAGKDRHPRHSLIRQPGSRPNGKVRRPVWTAWRWCHEQRNGGKNCW